MPNVNLSTKAAITAVILFISGFFPLVFFTSRSLEKNIETLLVNQQVASVNFVARDLEQKIKLRTEALQDVADHMPVGRLSDPAAISDYLSRRIAIYRLFPNGVNVIAKNGIGIVDEPTLEGRTHGDFSSLGYFSDVMKNGKASIGAPRHGRFSKAPGVAIAVPVRDKEGAVQAVLAGFINLTDKQVFDWDNATLGQSGHYTLVDVDHRMIIADKRAEFALKPVNDLTLGPLTDLIFDGKNTFKIGSDAAGVNSIITDTHILDGRWVLLASLPTSEAFTPIANLQREIYSLAFLILFILSATAWLLMRNQLGVITQVTKALQLMSSRSGELKALPISRHRDDEFGLMIHAYNELQIKLQTKEAELLKSKERLVDLFTHMSNGFALHQMIGDSCGTPYDYLFLEVNPSFEKLTGLRSSEIIGKSARDVLPTLEQHWIDKYANVALTGIGTTFEDHAEPLDKWYRVTAYSPQKGLLAVIIEDITELKKSQLELKYLAYHDVLTGLLNRALFMDRLSQAVRQSERRESDVAIAYLDLDGFKLVNDAYGHAAGDQLLIEVAARLKNSLRSGDSIARMGGDEFALLISDFGTMVELNELLVRLNSTIAKPYRLHGQDILISCSIGVTVFPRIDSESAYLLEHADEALYFAKKAGKNCFCVFDKSYDSLIHTLDNSPT